VLKSDGDRGRELDTMDQRNEFHAGPECSELPSDAVAPQHLPPVAPPSAGFIVQLFLIPALIVGVIVGIYLLFGLLASGELDWRQQVVDVRSANEHVRWRGALSLAQMLDADAQQGASGTGLSRNREIAAALTELFRDTMAQSPRDEEAHKQLEFVTKALGRLDSADVVLPVLLGAIDTDSDPELHKHVLTAVAMIAGRAFERNAPLDDASLVRRVIVLSEGADVLSRHQAAFILGLTRVPEARARLEVLLQDGDLMTRANAAIGLARQKSTDGLPVFEEVFADLAARPLDPSTATTDGRAQEYFERYVLYSNCLKAIELLRPELAPDVRQRIVSVLDAVARSTGDARIQVETKQIVYRLTGG
jgi:hypothetical protein